MSVLAKRQVNQGFIVISPIQNLLDLIFLYKLRMEMLFAQSQMDNRTKDPWYRANIA